MSLAGFLVCSVFPLKTLSIFPVSCVSVAVWTLFASSWPSAALQLALISLINISYLHTRAVSSSPHANAASLFDRRVRRDAKRAPEEAAGAEIGMTCTKHVLITGRGLLWCGDGLNTNMEVGTMSPAHIGRIQCGHLAREGQKGPERNSGTWRDLLCKNIRRHL